MKQPPCNQIIGDTFHRGRIIVHHCEHPSTFRYPAMGGGFAYLCEEHGAKHADFAEHITRGFGKHSQDESKPHRVNWPRWEP